MRDFASSSRKKKSKKKIKKTLRFVCLCESILSKRRLGSRKEKGEREKEKEKKRKRILRAI
jgi:hypothetical protein